MAVTLFFSDGRIQEFPSATMVKAHGDLLHLMRYSPQLALEWVATFPTKDVSLAQVYEYGTLKHVVSGGRPAA